jgi:hypothetical protein
MIAPVESLLAVNKQLLNVPPAGVIWLQRLKVDPVTVTAPPARKMNVPKSVKVQFVSPTVAAACISKLHLGVAGALPAETAAGLGINDTDIEFI